MSTLRGPGAQDWKNEVPSPPLPEGRSERMECLRATVSETKGQTDGEEGEETKAEHHFPARLPTTSPRSLRGLCSDVPEHPSRKRPTSGHHTRDPSLLRGAQRDIWGNPVRPSAEPQEPGHPECSGPLLSETRLLTINRLHSIS